MSTYLFEPTKVNFKRLHFKTVQSFPCMLNILFACRVNFLWSKTSENWNWWKTMFATSFTNLGQLRLSSTTTRSRFFTSSQLMCSETWYWVDEKHVIHCLLSLICLHRHCKVILLHSDEILQIRLFYIFENDWVGDLKIPVASVSTTGVTSQCFIKVRHCQHLSLVKVLLRFWMKNL